jgi:hypothetical protein
MFGFQVEANVKPTQSLLADSSIRNRARAWMA